MQLVAAFFLHLYGAGSYVYVSVLYVFHIHLSKVEVAHFFPALFGALIDEDAFVFSDSSYVQYSFWGRGASHKGEDGVCLFALWQGRQFLIGRPFGCLHKLPALSCRVQVVGSFLRGYVACDALLQVQTIRQGDAERLGWLPS